VTVFKAVNHLSTSPSHPGQLSLLPSAGREIVPAKVRRRSAAGVKGRYDSFHLWINVWVAGKTECCLVNTCHRTTLSALQMSIS